MKHIKTLIILAVISTAACRKENDHADVIGTTKPDLTIEEAKSWYEKQLLVLRPQDQAAVNTKTTAVSGLSIPWERFTSVTNGKITYGLVGLDGTPTFAGYSLGYRKLLIIKTAADTLSGNILEVIPEPIYLQSHTKVNRADFCGRIFFYDLSYRLVKGFVYANGQIIGQIRPSEKSVTKTSSIGIDIKPIMELCNWYDDNYVNGQGEVVVYSQKICTYDNGDDGFYGGSGVPSGGDYAGGGGGNGGSTDAAPPVANLPGENSARIDPMSYMNCFSTLPDIGAKMTITVYVVEAAPGLPFNIGTNSVGHTAIGLTKTYQGQTITQVVGFYPDATGKSKMHAPSKILDNSDLAYNVSISYPIIASEFAKIVNFISHPPDTYDLTQYNCTSFVYNACLAGGIKLPDPTGNMGLGLTGMTPSALGSSIRQVGSTGGANLNGGIVGKNHGPCN